MAPVRATTRAHSQVFIRVIRVKNAFQWSFREAMATQAWPRRPGFVRMGRVSKANGRLIYKGFTRPGKKPDAPYEPAPGEKTPAENNWPD